MLVEHGPDFGRHYTSSRIAVLSSMYSSTDNLDIPLFGERQRGSSTPRPRQYTRTGSAVAAQAPPGAVVAAQAWHEVGKASYPGSGAGLGVLGLCPPIGHSTIRVPHLGSMNPGVGSQPGGPGNMPTRAPTPPAASSRYFSKVQVYYMAQTLLPHPHPQSVKAPSLESNNKLVSR